MIPMAVTARLVPAIHAAPLREILKVSVGGGAWMPGTRPGMTGDSYKNASTPMISFSRQAACRERDHSAT
jgi:hypothetical protein